MNSEEQNRKALRAKCEEILTHITLNYDGPFVVIEKVGGTVVGPYDTVTEALEGVEQWHAQYTGMFEALGMPVPDLDVVPLWKPSVVAA